MSFLRAGFPALLVCLLVLLPQVHAFGAGSKLFYTRSCDIADNLRYRLHLRRRGQELAPWRHRGHAQDRRLHRWPQMDFYPDQARLLRQLAARLVSSYVTVIKKAGTVS